MPRGGHYDQIYWCNHDQPQERIKVDFEISSGTVDIDGDSEPDVIFKKIEAHMAWPYFKNAPVQLTNTWSISFDGHEDVTNVN